MNHKTVNFIWVLLRFSLSFIFLWAFFDKLFGLGFATQDDKSWLKGISPTLGFLKYATYGPLATFYQNIAGHLIVDLLFMGGLLLIGLSLLFGIGIKIAGYSGALMMFLMWSACLPPENNPFLDEHIVYLLIFIGLTKVKAGHTFGLGRWWSSLKIVKRYPFLE